MSGKSPRAKRYSLRAQRTALTALALAAGDVELARETLREDDQEVPPARTLRAWRLKKSDEYERIREELEPRLRAQVAESATRQAMRLATLHDSLVERLGEEYAELPARDLAGSIRNIATSQAIMLDKRRDLKRSESSVVVADHKAALSTLRRLGILEAGQVTEQKEPAE